eukprot:CAMPEP_0113902064 /NCGR_PEP_ID=MMETSP0780_2-20120614/21625_1 /TAXON_ID=652834 /ORGANISM="Palpitomonas bilix" /LENGTH=35 /DNA_ID=CAMNT_0000894793 /DNA_START=805 /DNA_END=912 /DNA_ORIENTATION=- /assembly_acc=CAM_ASM_000599
MPTAAPAIFSFEAQYQHAPPTRVQKPSTTSTAVDR